MLKLKELFILFLILISVLIINFNNKNAEVNNLEKTTKTQTQKNELESLFINETHLLIKQPENTESIPSTISNENTNPQETSLEDFVQETTTLSLETVLTEIKNMSLEIESELNEDREDREEEINFVLKDYLSSIGYSSWKEYSSSEDYYLAKEWFLVNKDSFKEEFENALPLCSTVLAVGAGGACSCDYAVGTCYQDTPAGRYYHCLGACCCACCPICCGGF